MALTPPILKDSGKWVRAGDRDFLDTDDPSLAAQGLEALKQLQQWGIVAHFAEDTHRLTDSGWEVALELLNAYNESRGNAGR